MLTEAQISKRGLAYYKLGESGTPVMLVMGLGMHGHAWSLQAEHLSKHHQVAFFDHYGLGKSQPVPKGMNHMRKMADDALDIMDELGWDKAHLVGISMGGMISQHMALMMPERFLSLSLLATTAGGLLRPIPTWKWFQRFPRLATASKPEARAQAIKSILFPPDYLKELSDEQHLYLESVYGHEVPLSTVLSHVRVVMTHNTQKQLSQLTLPTMIVKPGQDILIPPNESERLYKLLPEARFHVYEEAGHGLLRQCTERINHDLLAHFRDAE